MNYMCLKIAAVNGKEQNGVIGENGTIVKKMNHGGQRVGSI